MKLLVLAVLSMFGALRLDAQSAADSSLAHIRAGVADRRPASDYRLASRIEEEHASVSALPGIAAASSQADHARIGAIVGAAVGASVILSLGWNSFVECGAAGRCPNSSEKFEMRLGLGAVGGLLGAGAGALIGTLFPADPENTAAKPE